MTRRVVITGMGALTPLGLSVAPLWEGLAANRSGVRSAPEWEAVPGLHVRIGAFVPEFNEKIIPRPARRTMGRVAQLAAVACQQAAQDAHLEEADFTSERLGLIYGSTLGSPSVAQDYFVSYAKQGMDQINGTDFLKVMSHTTAVNVSLFLGITGRVESLAAACATSTQAIGSAYEAIAHGLADVMLCGGSEELHPTTAGTFDILYATSRTTDPGLAPRPFDAARDGLVLGEGAGALVLEELARARARGAKIYGEVLGYATTCSAIHMTQPHAESMATCMRQALSQAGLEPAQVAAVNAHATGTLQGDAAEAQATRAFVGTHAPITAFKGQLGHTLAASGAIECIAIAGMFAQKELWPITHLQNPLPEGEGLDFVRTKRAWVPGPVLKNSFAFGGINASLVLAPADPRA
jgi:3-oxoacyl-[acyl-carrier-protein] synthase II